MRGATEEEIFKAIMIGSLLAMTRSQPISFRKFRECVQAENSGDGFRIDQKMEDETLKKDDGFDNLRSGFNRNSVTGTFIGSDLPGKNLWR